MLAEDESARAPNFADYVNHFRLRYRNHVVRIDLNVLFRVFGLHDFFQVELGYRELTGRIQMHVWQREASPFEFTSDAYAVPRVLTYASGEGQHFEQRLVPLHLVNA